MTIGNVTPDEFLDDDDEDTVDPAQEAAQRRFVSEPTLPRQFCGPNDRQILEGYGVEFGEPVDELFFRVKLPAGWSKVYYDFQETHLLDDRGRVRASMSYGVKRPIAHIHPVPRFEIDHDELVDANGNPCEQDKATHYAVSIKDGGQRIHRIGIHAGRDRALRKEQLQAAQGWLNSRYPDWQNPAAYWD